MDVEQTFLPGVAILSPPVHADDRGSFRETFNAERFVAAGIDFRVAQSNVSVSRAGVLRGIHYQLVRPQAKLVGCLAGEVFDVAVDLRRGSPTFGQSVGTWLTPENGRQLLIPVGFGHAFFVRGGPATVVYHCSDVYVAEHDRAIAWDSAGIDWPAEVEVGGVTLSAKDLSAPPLGEAEVYDDGTG